MPCQKTSVSEAGPLSETTGTFPVASLFPNPSKGERQNSCPPFPKRQPNLPARAGLNVLPGHTDAERGQSPSEPASPSKGCAWSPISLYVQRRTNARQHLTAGFSPAPSHSFKKGGRTHAASLPSRTASAKKFLIYSAAEFIPGSLFRPPFLFVQRKKQEENTLLFGLLAK